MALERLRKEHVDANFQPEIQISEPVPLKEIVVKVPEDTLGLANEKFTLVQLIDEKSQSIIYLGQLDHPFLGEHFAQLLNARAPFTAEDKFGVIGDIKLPEEATKEKGAKPDFAFSYARLHKMHRESQTIGKTYMEFVNQHVKQWSEALVDNEFDNVFAGLQKLLPIHSKASLAFHMSRYCIKSFSNPSPFVNKAFLGGTLALQYRKGEPLYRFLRTQVDFSDITNYPELMQNRMNFIFFRALINQKTDLLVKFIEQLPEEEQGEFGLMCALTESRLIVDPKRRRVWQKEFVHGKRGYKVNVSFLGEENFAVSDNRGTSVEINTGDSNDTAWQVTGYTFPQDYRSKALYGLLAWKKDYEGKRAFISQQEAVSFPHIPTILKSKTDVFLGRVLSAYFSPDITKQFQSEMVLSPHGKLQQMMGAQMPVWVSLPQHETLLLSDQNPFFKNLEDFASSYNYNSE